MKLCEEPLSMQLAKYVRPASCACRSYGNLPCTRHLMKVRLGVYSSNATTYLLNLLLRSSHADHDVRPQRHAQSMYYFQLKFFTASI
jgi:hypothetical protein